MYGKNFTTTKRVVAGVFLSVAAMGMVACDDNEPEEVEITQAPTLPAETTEPAPDPSMNPLQSPGMTDDDMDDGTSPANPTDGGMEDMDDMDDTGDDTGS